MHCCGVNNYTDFDIAENWVVNKTNNEVMPAACCILQEGTMTPEFPDCQSNPTSENSYYLTVSPESFLLRGDQFLGSKSYCELL